MENQCISSNDLDGIEIYIFGSFLYSIEPEDIDVLFIFDSCVIPYEDAHDKIRPVVTKINNSTKLKVHKMVLSKDEAKSVDVFLKYKCINIKELTPNNCFNLTRLWLAG